MKTITKILTLFILTMLLAAPAQASFISNLDQSIRGVAQSLSIATQKLALPGSDFTINSITSTKILSNDADLQSANFIVSTTANGGGQSVAGTFDESDFKQYTGYSTTYPLTISMGGISETLSYPVRNQGSLYKWDYQYSNSFDWDTDWQSYCISGYPYCFKVIIPGSWYAGNTYKTLNVKQIAIGSYGGFDNPNINWAGQITMTINGAAVTKNIGSAETPSSVDFYNGNEWMGNAKWTGSLITGQATPNPSLYTAVYSGSTWKVSGATFYNDYTNSLTSSKSTIGTWAGSISSQACMSPCNPVLNEINKHNLIVDTLTTQNTKITYAAGTEETLQQTSQGGAANGMIVESTNRRISNPQIILTVKASKLGVIIPVGKPQITSISAPTFSSGSNTGAAIVNFMNIGSGIGTFAATFTESSGTFSPSAGSNKITLGPGQSGSITVYISHGSAAQTITKTASMRVYDYNKPSNYDEKVFSINMNVPKACAPGTKRFSGQLVYTCNSDGMSETLTLDCTGGLIQPDGTCKMPDGAKDTQIVAVSIYAPDKVTLLSDAPIIIEGKGQVGTGFKEISLPLGTYSISTNNLTNPTLYAPEPEVITLNGGNRVEVKMYFSNTPGVDMTWIFWFLLAIIIIFIAYKQGIFSFLSKNPAYIILVLFMAYIIYILYEVLLMLYGIADTVNTAAANPWLPWNW